MTDSDFDTDFDSDFLSDSVSASASASVFDSVSNFLGSGFDYFNVHLWGRNALLAESCYHRRLPLAPTQYRALALSGAGSFLVLLSLFVTRLLAALSLTCSFHILCFASSPLFDLTSSYPPLPSSTIQILAAMHRKFGLRAGGSAVPYFSPWGVTSTPRGRPGGRQAPVGSNAGD